MNNTDQNLVDKDLPFATPILWGDDVMSREMLDALGELVYVMDTQTHELLFMNSPTQELFHCRDDYFGKKCYRVLQNSAKPCSFCPVPKLSYNEFYDWQHTNPVNGHHYILKDRLLNWKGRNAHLEIAFDVTAQTNERLALSRALSGERMVLECVQMLGDAETNLDSAIQRTLEKLGHFLCAERAYIFQICGGKMHNTHEWCAPGSIPQIENLQEMDISLLDRWRDEFERENCVIIPDLEAIKLKSPDEYNTLHAQGIKSLVAVPLFQEKNSLIGYVGVDNPPADTLHNIKQLLQTLQHFLMVSFSRAQERELLLHVGYYDNLTGLFNRNRYISDVHACTLTGSVGIVYLDVNGMKEYNDCYGHEHGDQVLKKCADFMRNCFDAADCYRIGGDEFIIIWKGCTQEIFSQHLLLLKREFAFSSGIDAAIGARWEEGNFSLADLIQQADRSMYAAKKQYYRTGKSYGRYRHGMDDVLNITEPNVLKRLLEERAFLVYLQPKVSFTDRALAGAEALVRLQMNSEIFLPDSFIPHLEETSLIAQVDFYVFSTVCELLSRWQEQGKTLLPIAVNFSRHSLMELDFILKLTQICSKHHVSRHWLEIEITESVEGFPGFNLYQMMNQIRDAGFTVSLDDFGAHYSNVSMLAFSKFDVLKFDKNLVMEVVQNQRLQMMLDSVVRYSRQLGIKTVAEGVETEEQFDVLRRLGINQAQGYLCGRPTSIDDYEHLFLC